MGLADRMALRALVIWMMLSIIVTLAGPFGTYEKMPLWLRLPYWTALIGVAVPMAWAVRRFGAPRVARLPQRWGALILAFTLSVVFTPVIYIATDLMAARGLANMVPVWLMWEITMLSSLAVCAVRILWLEGDVAASPEAVPPVQPEPPMALPRLLLRVEPETRGSVLHLSGRDHYVDVQTDRGRTTLLMRLADAIGELDGVAGMQVHRSHWVAEDAVEAVERDEGKLFLRLSTGARVPVSRNHRAKLEARGLI